MGFFSFLTNDTEESISNKYSIKPTFTIHMLDNKGNVWTEHNYEGYGVFGGKDIYQLIAEMNNLNNRDAAIGSCFNEEISDTLIYPNIVRNISKWKKWKNKPLTNCEFQGYFYNINESDEEYQPGDEIDDAFDDTFDD